MSPEKTKILYEKYPDIFRNRSLPMSQTCMCWGFECDDGWFKLIDELCAQLAFLQKVTGCSIVADQVKEKFGELRFYYTMSFGDIPETEHSVLFNIVAAVVDRAANQSTQTCEITGEYGSPHVRQGWWKTVSEEKAKELGFITSREYKKQCEEAERTKNEKG